MSTYSSFPLSTRTGAPYVYRPATTRAMQLAYKQEDAILQAFTHQTGFVQRKDGIVPRVESATLSHRAPGVETLEAQVRLAQWSGDFLPGSRATSVKLFVSSETGETVRVKPTFREAMDIFIKAL